MKRVCDLLDDKGRAIWSLPPDATVYEAIERMAEKKAGALLIIEQDRLVGILSERDYTRKVVLQGKSSQKTRIGEIMGHPVICIDPEATLDRAMVLMTDHRIRHLPVTVKDRVEGVISMGDVVRAVIESKESSIDEPADCIHQNANL